MEKPGKKLKKLLIITGTTGAVYAGFKYLLPLVAPFFVGYIFALLLRPSARFLAYRMRVTVKGKRYHMPIGVIGDVYKRQSLQWSSPARFREFYWSCCHPPG